MLRSNLKQILFERDLSIREVARAIDENFELVRRLHNDDTERYPRELLYKLCKYLNIGINELLVFDNEDNE